MTCLTAATAPKGKQHLCVCCLRGIEYEPPCHGHNVCSRVTSQDVQGRPPSMAADQG